LLQVADLLLQLLFLGLVGEDGNPLRKLRPEGVTHELRLPLHDGVGVDVVDAGKLHQALLPLDGLKTRLSHAEGVGSPSTCGGTALGFFILTSQMESVYTKISV